MVEVYRISTQRVLYMDVVECHPCHQLCNQLRVCCGSQSVKQFVTAHVWLLGDIGGRADMLSRH